MIIVALVSTYPTEAEARVVLTDPDVPYLGIWRLPVPEHTRVHVFTDTTAEHLEAIGWTKEAEA